jgi:hypothetical protein
MSNNVKSRWLFWAVVRKMTRDNLTLRWGRREIYSGGWLFLGGEGVARGKTLQEENRFLDQGIDGRVTLNIYMNERRWKDFDRKEHIPEAAKWLLTDKRRVSTNYWEITLLGEKLSASEGGLYIVELIAVSWLCYVCLCVCHFDVQPRKSGLKSLF